MAIVQSIKQASKAPVTFQEIKQWYEGNLAPGAVNLDDPHVYENVYHEGRWAGIFQCVDAQTNIRLASGDYRQIAEISAGEEVMALDETTNEFVVAPVVRLIDQGVKACIELTFDDGKTLVCTADHPIKTRRGWIVAGDLTHDDDVISYEEKLGARD